MPNYLKYTKLLILFAFLSISSTNAQYNVDSLKTIIANNKLQDTTKLKALGFLLVNISNTSKEYNYYNEKFKIIANQSLKKKLDALSKEKAYDALGVYHMNKAFQLMQSDYLLTIKYLDKSLDYFSPKYFTSDKYISARAYVLVSLGVMYNKIGSTNQSINNYFQALQIFEKLKDKNSISYALQSIANLYREQKKYDIAIQFYLKSYYTYYKSDNLSFQDNIQKVLLFINIAKCHQGLDNCDVSNSFLNKGLTLALKLKDQDVLSEIYFNLGQNEEKCNLNNNSALLAYEKSFTNSKLPENNANSLIAI